MPDEASTVDDRPRRDGASEPHELTRGTTVGRYVVIDKLGAGGQGVVYSAYDHALHRRVALKLVTERRNRSAQERLVAEARTMAQLTHPALVAVFDVGEFRGQVFLAMEFIDGETLRHWQAREHSCGDIVAMYVRIGDGLAFAHDAGVIHRDFKPDNVLVDASGRPHVTDFGLAKVHRAVEEASPATSLITKHTISGKIAGTPGYWSPEQRQGEPTDARTDQYSFCAALYEALFGVLPPDVPAEPREVPREVMAAVQRGLEEDPDRRWPSLRERLQTLEPRRRPRRVWPLVAGGITAVAIVVGGVVVAARDTHESTCAAPAARTMWTERHAAVDSAFAAQGGSAKELASAIEDWISKWTAMAQSSCQATKAGEQSAQLLDLRAQCLGHQLDVVTQLVELARHADHRFVVRAARTARELPSLEPCEDAAGLLGVRPLPVDPIGRARIAGLRKQLATAEALREAGSLDAALDILRPLAAQAEQLNHGPLTLEIVGELATVELLQGSDAKAAAAAVWTAIAADPTRVDQTMVSAWLDLVWIVGEAQHLPSQALDIARVAEALVQRAGSRHQRALLDYRVATMLGDLERYDEAFARFDQRTISERRALDLLAVDERAIARAQVFDVPAPFGARESCVPPRHPRIGKRERERSIRARDRVAVVTTDNHLVDGVDAVPRARMTRSLVVNDADQMRDAGPRALAIASLRQRSLRHS